MVKMEDLMQDRVYQTNIAFCLQLPILSYPSHIKLLKAKNGTPAQYVKSV